MADEVKPTSIKEIEVEGYKFNVDTDMLDDVDTLEFLERIENKGQVAAILPLLVHIMGEKGYADLKAFFVAKDGAEHADVKDYRPRMRMPKLQTVYIAILEKFDPKG
jgi:hypothetical protein